MSPILGAALDFAKLEGRNIVIHNGAAPAGPVKGQMYFDTGNNTLFWYDGTAWQSAKGGVPAAHASTHQPGGADAMAVDAAVGTGSLRTLGTGANQAAAGNDSRFGAAADATTSSKGIVQLAGDLAGTATSPQIAAGAVTDVEVAAANKDGAVGTASMRTLGFGASQAMRGSSSVSTISQTTGNTGSLDMNSQRIIALNDPTGPQDGATKNYVDTVAQGLDAKASVKCSTTTDIGLTGVGPMPDGVTVVVGDRVLVKAQTAPAQNGIYVVAAGAWTRATDADAWGELPGAFVFVEQGTQFADSGWVCTVDPGGTLGTTAVAWAQFSGAGQITAGLGLVKTGNTLDVGAGAGLSVSADTVNLATPVSVAMGGTNATTDTGARTQLSAAKRPHISQGPSGAGTTYVVPQSTHGHNPSRCNVVQVQDVATGAIELPDVTVAANGDVTVTWGASQTGNSKWIIISGA